jgi:hypothetical protein
MLQVGNIRHVPRKKCDVILNQADGRYARLGLFHVKLASCFRYSETRTPLGQGDEWPESETGNELGNSANVVSQRAAAAREKNSIAHKMQVKKR